MTDRIESQPAGYVPPKLWQQKQNYGGGCKGASESCKIVGF
jgi:hypothetical protein